MPKSAKNYETILPFSCCPLVFPWERYRGVSPKPSKPPNVCCNACFSRAMVCCHWGAERNHQNRQTHTHTHIYMATPSKKKKKINIYIYIYIYIGVTEGGFHSQFERYNVCRSTMVPWHPDRHASATSPSLLRDDQNLRDNRVTVQWRRAGCRASPYRHPGCRANVVPPG